MITSLMNFRDLTGEAVIQRGNALLMRDRSGPGKGNSCSFVIRSGYT